MRRKSWITSATQSNFRKKKHSGLFKINPVKIKAASRIYARWLFSLGLIGKDTWLFVIKLEPIRRAHGV